MCRSPFLGALYATRGDRGRSRHRNRYSGSAATATAYVRAHLAAHARIQPPSVLNASICREHEPLHDRTQKDHAPRALAVDAVWPTRSPLSRFGAAERRSREHSSEHTKVCRHADEQATLLPAAKLLQPPSAAEHKPNCRLGTGEWMSASAEVSGRVRDQRDAH